MSILKELLSHSSHYFIGRVLVLLAGFISMPVLTRILSKEDYGLLSLIFLSLTLFSTIATFGFPQATTRFYSEYKIKRDIRYLRQFCTSMSIGSVVTGTAAMFIAICISYLVENSSSFSGLAYYLRYASILILIRVVTGVVLQIYRADKIPMVYNLIILGNRYLAIFCSILLVVYIYNNIKGVLVGTIAIEGVMVILCLVVLHFSGRLGFEIESSEPIKKAIKFGLPLVIADLLTTIVAQSDRFAIQYFMNSEAVANYSVAYDLSDYIGAIFTSPIQLAIMPIIFELWAKEGYDKVSYFVSQAIKYAFVIGVPVIFGFSLVSEKIIVLVASDKYAGSGVLVPFIISGVMLSSVHFLFFVGLLLERKSAALAILNCGAAVLNITLNVILIPWYGILGAAYAMVVTYLVLIVITHKISSRYLRIVIKWMALIKSVLLSAGMVMFLVTLGNVSNNLIADVIFKSVIGCFFYSIALVIADKDIRNVLLQSVWRKYIPNNL